MSLKFMLSGNWFEQLATATPATIATFDTGLSACVAIVAGVAVANPSDHKIDRRSEPQPVRESTNFCVSRPPTVHACRGVSMQHRSADEWLRLVVELDGLIEQFCAAYRPRNESGTTPATLRIARSRASIPESLAWFQREVAAIPGQVTFEDRPETLTQDRHL